MYDFLPIGSVVLLKNANKRLMIFGRLQREMGGEQKTWDYIGCTYPEGNMNPNESVLFNHDMIATVYFIGFQDTDEFAYKQELIKACQRLESEK